MSKWNGFRKNVFKNESSKYTAKVCVLIPYALIYMQHVYDFGNIWDILHDQQCCIKYKIWCVASTKRS